MPELVGQHFDTAKNTPQRLAVASQLRFIRQVEKAGEYNTHRDINDYLVRLGGLKNYFDYVRMLDTSNLVLDVGSGVTRGIWELSQSELAQGLQFMATGLVKNSEVRRYLGDENFRITSGEVLRGIQDNSVAAIIALYSVAYSASPEMVINRFDQVLVPGGIVKGTFRGQYSAFLADFYDRTQFKTPGRFMDALKELGYDVAVFDKGVSSTLLAIKPGGVIEITAQQLLDADQLAYEARPEVALKAMPIGVTLKILRDITELPVRDDQIANPDSIIINQINPILDRNIFKKYNIK